MPEPISLLNGLIKIAVNGYSPDTRLRHLYMGLTSNVNMGSALLALSFPAFLRKKWWTLTPIILFCAWISGSLGGKIPIILAIIMFILLRIKTRKHVLCAIIMMVSIGYVMYGENIDTLLSGSGRTTYAYNILTKMAIYKPIIGFGNGMFKIMYNPIASKLSLGGSALTYAHSEYIQVIMEQGLIGLVLILGYGFCLAKAAWRNRINYIPILGLMVVMFNSGVNFLFHTSMFVMALIYGAIIESYIRESYISHNAHHDF